MAVSITITEIFPNGAAISDGLAGGGTGLSLGSVLNGSYAPVSDAASNTGAQNLYIFSNAVVDPITDVKTFIEDYTATGFSYGGADTSANDYTDLKNQGNSSGDSKNNVDGLSGGLWIEMNSDVSSTAQFDFINNGYDTVGGTNGGTDTVRKYGDNLTDGISLASAFIMKADAMVYNAPGETLASSPVDGSIGKAGDTVLGDHAHFKLRIYIRSDFTDNGLMQFAYTTAFSFTS